MSKLTSSSLRFVAIAGVAALCACSPLVQRHGYVPTAEDLAQLTPGAMSRSEALAVLPAPTTQGVVDQGNIYYVASTFEHFGPFPAKETKREVVAITFDAAGRLTGVERYGLEDGQIVPLLRRVTRDNVADMSFIRQLMGNLGRMDPGALLGAG